MIQSKDALHAPFLHPRRDPHFRKARWIAAAFLSLVQAAWFFSFVIAVQNGTKLTTSVSLIGLAGFFLIASRAGLVADLALGVVDRLGRL